jgi:hypothetical protein
MKAILIDPGTRTITDVDCGGELEDLYTALDCRCVDARQIDGDIFAASNAVFFNDEELLDDKDIPRHFFELKTEGGSTGPIPGKGLVVGYNEEKRADVTLTVADVRKIITFTERRFRGFRTIKPGLVEHPVLGTAYQFGITADLPIVDGANEEEPK